MSPDVFEDEIRTLLRDATDAESTAFADVDPSGILLDGRRVVRRRRVAMVGGTMAAALVVAAGTWVAVSDGADRAAPVPATRTSAATGATTALLDAFSGLTEDDGSEATGLGPDRLAVTIDPTREPDLVFSSVGTDGQLTQVAGSSLRGVSPLASTWGTGSGLEHAVVGVLPEGAVTFQVVTPLTDAGGHASTSVQAPLPGTGRQAFAVRFAEPDAAEVQHLLWHGRDGSVHDETGAVVPSVRLRDTGTTVFYSERVGRFGYFDDDGAAMVGLDTSRNSSRRPVLSTGRGEGSTMASRFLAVVPRTAVPSGVDLEPGATLTHPLTLLPVPGTDRAVLWAEFSAPSTASVTPYRGVTWSEAGRPVTQRP